MSHHDLKKHSGHPELTGEHRWGDAGQLILLVLFLGIWICDSFIFHYSDSLSTNVPGLIRIPLALLFAYIGINLARKGLKAVFGTERAAPELITNGVFKRLRHPIYTGALCFYITMIIATMSIASALFFIIILAFYYFIARYEERKLIQAFGEEYIEYRRTAGMLLPRFF